MLMSKYKVGDKVIDMSDKLWVIINIEIDTQFSGMHGSVYTLCPTDKTDLEISSHCEFCFEMNIKKLIETELEEMLYK